MDENKIINPWQAMPKAESRRKKIEVVHGIDKKDPAVVQEILKNVEFLRVAVLGRHFKEVKAGFAFLFKERFGRKLSLEDLKWEEAEEILKEYNLPEQILVELLEMAYHEKDDLAFLNLLAIIKKNIKNPLILARADHAIATNERRKGNTLGAKESNQKARGYTNDKILDLKTEFGDLADGYANSGSGKLIKVEKKETVADQYASIFQRMEEVGHLYDAYRARIEEAKIRFELANIQKKKKQIDAYEKNILKAYDLAKKALRYAEDSDYKRLEALSLKTLNDILFLDQKIKKIKPEPGEQPGIYRKKAKGLGLTEE